MTAKSSVKTHRMFEQREYEYVIWQNRAFRFYEAARLLHKNEMYAPAAYSATMAIELILKATLKYWLPSENPEDHGHGICPLMNTIKNKVPQAKSFSVPKYFYWEHRYLKTSRYPTSSKGIGVPATFVDDLDLVFFSAVKLSPFQYNTELVNTLSATNTRRYRNVTAKNQQTREARKFLKIVSRKAPTCREVNPITIEELAELLSHE